MERQHVGKALGMEVGSRKSCKLEATQKQAHKSRNSSVKIYARFVGIATSAHAEALGREREASPLGFVLAKTTLD